MPLLEVRDLRTSFFLEGGEARAVDGVSFALDAGRVLGLVGESGCGKSVTALSLMRLVPPPGRIVGGEVRLAGRDLLGRPGSAPSSCSPRWASPSPPGARATIPTGSPAACGSG